LILCGDLVRAVKREAAIAVAHHWSVSVNTVKRWRRALGVPRTNDGTHELTRKIAFSRDDDRLPRARVNSKLLEALKKLSRSLKGRVQSPKTLAALLAAAKRPRTEAWKQKMSAYWRRRGHPPGTHRTGSGLSVKTGCSARPPTQWLRKPSGARGLRSVAAGRSSASRRSEGNASRGDAGRQPLVRELQLGTLPR
jgi:hypothetical protein